MGVFTRLIGSSAVFVFPKEAFWGVVDSWIYDFPWFMFVGKIPE